MFHTGAGRSAKLITKSTTGTILLREREPFTLQVCSASRPVPPGQTSDPSRVLFSWYTHARQAQKGLDRTVVQSL